MAGVVDRMRARPPHGLMGWRLWLGWVLASTVGWAGGGPVGAAVVSNGNIVLAGSIGLAAGGLMAGVLQVLVLRPLVARSGWWVMTIPLAAAVAGVVGLAAGAVAGGVSPPGQPSPLGGADVGVDVGWVVSAGLFGPALGLLQFWLVLRRQVPHAGWWVLASTVAWVAGGPGVGFVSAIMGATGGAAVSWATLGAVYGAVTGPVLVGLLRQPAAAVATKE